MRYLSIFFCFLLAVSCAKKTRQPEENILVRVADRDISVNEFVRRAEYTIRPAYCRGNFYIHKKIVLNSLITEKLLALEADSSMLHNTALQDYIKGRREQAMRQVLFYQQAYEKTSVDTNDIKPVYRMTGREYDVSFISFPNAEMAQQFGADIRQKKIDFERFYEIQGISDIPKQKITLKSDTHPDIFNALFARPVQKGEVIGPLYAQAGNYLFLRVDGWVDRPAVTANEMQQRWTDAAKYVRNQKALTIWQQYKSQVMKGKNLQFNEKAFYPLSDLFFKIYFKSPKDQKQSLQQHMWEREKPDVPQHYFDNVNAMLDEPFFKVDDRTYTVGDFKKMYASHPLVFRNPFMDRAEFPQQFKLAVVDMVMDMFLTEKACKLGLQHSPLVKRNEQMWTDAMLAIMEKRKLLENTDRAQDFERDYMHTINTFLNAYTDSLQNKYGPVIEIDTDAFEKINLTRIDMMVHQPNVPYPVMVPGFPLVTTDSKLDYGRKME